LPLDKAKGRVSDGLRGSPSQRFHNECKILLLDDLEFSCRPKCAADRQDRPSGAVDPKR